MIWILDHGPLRDYHDVWCSDELRSNDPEGCGVGLAIGYVWLPLVIGLGAAVLIYLLVSGYRVLQQRKEEV